MIVPILVHEWFTRFDYRWKIGSERAVPTQEDIKLALDKAITVLYPEPVGTQLEVGRLIIQKTGPDTHDVYMFVGTMED